LGNSGVNREKTERILDAMRGKVVLVVGDVMLDEFIWGNVSRISPEAPVPVVEVERESYFPGGAANVARNLAEFCEDVRILSRIGLDGPGKRLKGLLAERGIRLDWLFSEPGYSTIVKTRIIARHQQVVRVDRERASALSDDRRGAVAEQFRAMLGEVDAIIFEDYGKGYLDQELVADLLGAARAAGRIVTVDPNPRNRLEWRGITSATPNRSEAFALMGRPWSEPVSPPTEDGPLLEVGAGLLVRWEAEMLVVTLGEQGMMLFGRAFPPYHIPTRAREVFDVSGAGDTAVAVFTLALAAGATPIESAELSNRASGIVVGKFGTAIADAQEILAGLDDDA
jgi:D-beta-D-heptose 7-phosphate kinase/D-beta-D-heptose 1-phosphate adenosyltransferase